MKNQNTLPLLVAHQIEHIVFAFAHTAATTRTVIVIHFDYFFGTTLPLLLFSGNCQ
jgi:hypothetical protein